MTEPPSPRLQRLDVRTQKKASVEDASTLDFTSLSVTSRPHAHQRPRRQALICAHFLRPLLCPPSGM